jgi:hypothetical protein
MLLTGPSETRVRRMWRDDPRTKHPVEFRELPRQIDLAFLPYLSAPVPTMCAACTHAND